MSDFDYFKKEHLLLNDQLTFSNKKVEEYEDEIQSILDGTYIQPIDIGIKEVKPHFNMFWGMLMLVSGYPQSGKSEFTRFLACVHVASERGKVCIFSPESDTPMLMVDFINTIRELMIISWDQAKQIVNENILFKEIKDDLGLPDIKQLIEDSELLNTDGFNFFVIDPMNWVTSSMYTDSGMFEALRLTLTYLKQFAKTHKSIVCYVEHPKTPKLTSDGSVPMCSVFSINGGVMHNNKCDGIILLHRAREKDLQNEGKFKSSQSDPVVMEVAKLKFQKYLGVPGNIELQFDYKTGVYSKSKPVPITNYYEKENKDDGDMLF